MQAIAGLPVTRRRVQGPGFFLVGLGDARRRHTALWLPENSALARTSLRAPEGARAFLERPGVVGLARLAAVDTEERALAYATGEVWSVAEIGASLRRRGRSPGLRAGVELAWSAAQVLVAAHAEASPLGVHAHGAVDPWRLAVRRDGQVVVLGFGMLAGAEGLSGLSGPELMEALRYAPPERLAGQPEDLGSDLFSLALVAIEWALGEPVYRGSVHALRRQVEDAEGDRRLYTARDRLPADVREVLGRALRRDQDARWEEPEALVEALRTVLSSPHMEGPSLRQLVQGSDLDAPERFVGIDEERGAVDLATPEPAPEEEPVDTIESEPERRRARWVSLGGRRGKRKRTRAAPVSVTEEAPSRAGSEAAASAPALPPPAPEPEPEVEVAPSPSVEAEVAPPMVDAVVEMDEEDTDVRRTMVPLDEDLDEEEEDEDTSPARPSPAAASTPDPRPPPDEEPTRTFSREDLPTRMLSRSDHLARLTVGTEDGRTTLHIFDSSVPVAEASREISRNRRLPTTDLTGNLECAWVLARDGEILDDARTLEDTELDGALTLVRVRNKPCRVRVRVVGEGGLSVDTVVGRAVPAIHLVARLVETFELPPGSWRLSVDGLPLPDDAILGDRVGSGGVVELRR